MVGTWDVAELDAGDFFDDDGALILNGAVGVEELVGDVAEDGGATGETRPFGDENEEAGEEYADVVAGGEF